MADNSLEDIFAELDILTKQMEQSGISLEESMKLYKLAVSYIETAKEKLKTAKAEIDAIAGE
ncbi:MAG: exodeoxyribonuclease VII small subunit [Ruminococcus sp.]|jgi:exodeoxyribonuclease VII small subunit|nr:exodeoxyribonuclease VII small subunit [Ruminococcus sp.]